MASLTSAALPARPRNSAWGAVSVSRRAGSTQASCPSAEWEPAVFSLGVYAAGTFLPAGLLPDPWEGAGAGCRQLQCSAWGTALSSKPRCGGSPGACSIPRGKARGIAVGAQPCTNTSLHLHPKKTSASVHELWWAGAHFPLPLPRRGSSAETWRAAGRSRCPPSPALGCAQMRFSARPASVQRFKPAGRQPGQDALPQLGTTSLFI